MNSMPSSLQTTLVLLMENDRSYDNFVLHTLSCFKQFLHFPKWLLDDIETSPDWRSLNELNVYAENSLVIAVVIVKSSGKTRTSSYDGNPLNFDSNTLVFIKVFHDSIEYVHHEHEVFDHLLRYP
ncbi:hypothetical protein Tco_0587085 [Tanacetum coccineum]